MANEVRLVEQSKCFGGTVSRYSHVSAVCNDRMRFMIFLPPQATSDAAVPVLYYLAGLTCTEETFMAKGGAQRLAAELGIAIVTPDTSPRNARIEGETASWDFGQGAGFYVDAIQEPWHQFYRMYSYVTQELPAVIHANFPVDPQRQGIFGHSMGGHGALVCALKNPQQYRSVSAFAPICAPSEVPWGIKAFTGYLGDDRAAWAQYDASQLVRQQQLPYPILIDQGTHDKFLNVQLKPEIFQAACTAAGQPLELRMQQGYDHSYYFISTFIDDHLRHHARLLGVG